VNPNGFAPRYSFRADRFALALLVAMFVDEKVRRVR